MHASEHGENRSIPLCMFFAWTKRWVIFYVSLECHECSLFICICIKILLPSWSKIKPELASFACLPHGNSLLHLTDITIQLHIDNDISLIMPKLAFSVSSFLNSLLLFFTNAVVDIMIVKILHWYVFLLRFKYYHAFHFSNWMKSSNFAFFSLRNPFDSSICLHFL